MLYIPPRIKYLFLLFCCGWLWQGCNNIKAPQRTPTYIHIDSFHFKGNPKWPNLPVSSQITNVSVYYNNNPVGVFDLPATFPVIAAGYGTLEVSPGIIVDGLNNLTGVYPFYQADTLGFAAQPGKIINYTPVTSYYNNIVAHTILEHSSAIDFALDFGNVSMVRDSGAGSITLNAIGDSSIDSTTKTFAIPAGPAYIEFDYKSAIPFYVGLQAQLTPGIYSKPFYLSGIYPGTNNKWQKFYLSVTDFNGQYQATSYNFFIKAVLDSGQANGRLLIDNIYLLTLSQ